MGPRWALSCAASAAALLSPAGAHAAAAGGMCMAAKRAARAADRYAEPSSPPEGTCSPHTQRCGGKKQTQSGCIVRRWSSMRTEGSALRGAQRAVKQCQNLPFVTGPRAKRLRTDLRVLDFLAPDHVVLLLFANASRTWRRARSVLASKRLPGAEPEGPPEGKGRSAGAS